MRIAYVMDLILVCGGVLVAHEHCSRLRKKRIRRLHCWNREIG